MVFLAHSRISSIAMICFAVATASSMFGNAQATKSTVDDPQYCSSWQARIGVTKHPQKKLRGSPIAGSRAVNNERVEPMADDFASPAPADPDHVSDLTEPEIIAAMGCLLALEDNTQKASFTGVTWAGVSQLFAWAPVNVAALYYVSYLYTGNWKHGDAIALRGPGASSDDSRALYVTNQEAVHKAYASYRHWYEQLKRIGLRNAREQKLDPLEGTGLRWY
jgi:hypothetical protein